MPGTPPAAPDVPAVGPFAVGTPDVVEPDADMAGEAGAAKKRGLNAIADGLNLNSLAPALRPFLDAVEDASAADNFAAAPVAGGASAADVDATPAAGAGAAAGDGAGTAAGLVSLATAEPATSLEGVAAVAASAAPAGVPLATSAGTLLIAARSDELADVATLSEQVAAPDGARATDDMVDVTTDGDLELEPASASTSALDAGAGGGGSVSTPTDVTDAASEPARTVTDVIEPAKEAPSSTPLTSATAGRSSLDTSDRCDGARAERPDRRSADWR